MVKPISREKNRSQKSFYQITFGCQMNKHDSQRLAGLLVEKGYKAAPHLDGASIIIFNTCCVRGSAEQRLYGRVASLKSLKRENPGLIIAVGGCLAQNEGRKLIENYPHIDVVFGTQNLPRLPELIEKAAKDSASVCELSDEPQIMTTELPLLRKSSFQAWVGITQGCDNFCSYCIVPSVRGREVSRYPAEIREEVEKLAGEGVKEVTLLGQNVNSYGRGLNASFAGLLEELSEIPGIERIRFTTSHPRDLSSDIIETVASAERICEHFHLPLQAGSDRILRLMNRGYDQGAYLGLIRRIREKIPSASITTDIMVGFPSETEDDFEETLKVVDAARFDQAFTFIFSPRIGTKAYHMDNQVSDAVKSERFQRLVKAQEEISLQKNNLLLGRAEEVLAEGKSRKDPSILSGRTRTNKVVNFPGEESLLGKMITVTIKKVHNHSFSGVPVN